MRSSCLALVLLAAPAAAQTVDIGLEDGEPLLQTDANSRQVSELLAALRRAGVQSREMRTRQISVQPRFVQPPREAGELRQRVLVVGR